VVVRFVKTGPASVLVLTKFPTVIGRPTRSTVLNVWFSTVVMPARRRGRIRRGWL
jgi:hypothetical protein